MTAIDVVDIDDHGSKPRASLPGPGRASLFGRRYARLLKDPEYFKAFHVVQDANFGSNEPDDATLKRVDAATKTMEEIEARLHEVTQ